MSEPLFGRLIDMKTKILRRPEVTARYGIPESTLYAWMAKGEFPRPLKLGSRAVGWSDADLDAWLASRLEAKGVGVDGEHVAPATSRHPTSTKAGRSRAVRENSSTSDQEVA